MAQLRQEYTEFVARGAEVLVVGPEDQEAFQREWARESYPFVGLPDPEHVVADLYGQEVKLLQMGRLPALALIDRQGFIRYRHFANHMADIVANADLLELLDSFNAEL